MRVGYTGEPGAFAEEAVLRFFASPTAVPMSSFRAVFEAVRDGEVAAGVVPVESSLLGTIRENLDLLWEFDLPVVGEVSVPVRLALLALPGERLESITRVYSISAALAQADEFLRSRPWTVQTTYNTAGAAKQVAERRERGSRGGRLGTGRADLRPGGPRGRHPVRDGQPDPVRGHRAPGIGAGAGAVGAATGPRLRVPCWGPPGPRRSRVLRGPRSRSPCGTCRGRSTARWGRSPAAG